MQRPSGGLNINQPSNRGGHICFSEDSIESSFNRDFIGCRRDSPSPLQLPIPAKEHNLIETQFLFDNDPLSDTLLCFLRARARCQECLH